MVGDSLLLLEDPRALPDQRSLHLLHSTICYAFVLLPRTRGGYNRVLIGATDKHILGMQKALTELH